MSVINWVYVVAGLTVVTLVGLAAILRWDHDDDSPP